MLKIAIFGGDAKSSQKIATFKVAIATTFASPTHFQNRHFGDLSPRLATLTGSLSNLYKHSKVFNALLPKKNLDNNVPISIHLLGWF